VFSASPPQDGFAVANLGQPRKLSGLKARFIFSQPERLDETRFQRLFPNGHTRISWGDATG